MEDTDIKGCAAIISAVAALITAIALFMPKDTTDDNNTDDLKKAKVVEPINSLCSVIEGLTQGVVETSSVYDGFDRDVASFKYNDAVEKTASCLGSDWTKVPEHEHDVEDGVKFYHTDFVRSNDKISIQWNGLEGSPPEYVIDIVFGSLTE